MAVDKDIDAGGVGDHGGGLPLLGGALDAQVAHGHHIVGAGGGGVIYRGLHRVIEVLAVVALGEAVDIVAVFVLEVGGGGLGEGLGGVDAHEGHGHAARLDEGVGVQDGIALQIGEVGAEVGILGAVLSQVQEVVHTVVELMVAGHGQIIAHLVHDVHDVGPLGEGTDGAALNGVAAIHQDDVVGAVLGLHLGLVGGHAGVADVGDGAGLLVRGLIDPAVHVIGVQDHDLGVRRLGGRDGNGQREDHRQGQKQGQGLAFHCCDSTFLYIGDMQAPAACMLGHPNSNKTVTRLQ